MAIVDCLGRLTDQWDRRLNTAYQVAIKASESDTQKNALIHAQRAWLNHRKENCGWYGSQEGTIRQILAAGCVLDMTHARAVELAAFVQP